MRYAAFLIVGPGEADRYLEQVLKQLWTDDICICLNNADLKTKNLCKRYANLCIEDNREWGVNQWRIKQDFLNEVLKLKPDWIWCLDSDEIFDPSFTKEKADQLATGNDIAWYFWCLQLWNEDDRVRLDLSFPNIRFYKVIADFGLNFQATPLHCGLAPRYAYQWGSQSNLYFKHYGLMKRQDRVNKIARYDKYDPDAKYKGREWYQGLRNEKAKTVSLDEAIQKLPDIIYKRKEIKKHMSKNNEIFMFRNKHGKPVPAVGDRQRDQFIKMGFIELSNLTVNSNREAEVIKSPEQDVDEGQYPAQSPVDNDHIEEGSDKFDKPKKNVKPRKSKKRV